MKLKSIKVALSKLTDLCTYVVVHRDPGTKLKTYMIQGYTSEIIGATMTTRTSM
jgi:hypothetical protein